VTDLGVAWAAGQWGRRIERVERLRGGWTSTMLRLTATDGEQAVLRLMTREPWRRHASGLLARESAVQTLLSGTTVPAATSLALDVSGQAAGDPAHLMSHLSGRVVLNRCDAGLLDALARLLRGIHAVDPGGEQPRDFESWAPVSKWVVPRWSRRPTLWRSAFERLSGPPPPYRAVFLHRDFHLGNVLWRDGGDGGVSGVVDWVETSWGPAELDVAHCATYLAMLHGPEAAERFVAAYGPGPVDPEATSRVRGGERGYWHVMDVVGYLPDPGKVVQPWRDQGVALSDEAARTRLERRLADVLAWSS
jgi:aminoglycoside phosphotransferase (APT) family kinase protein